jgi:adenine phosphoribosyltransferase
LPPSPPTSSTYCSSATCGRSLVDLRAHIRDIPDFPKPGIVFKDITPLLLYPPAFDEAVHRLAAWGRPREVDIVVAAEARGFILGGALAHELGAGFVPARKPGKLPADTVSAEYLLEYGVDALHVHADALADGARVLLHDDLLATGGTAGALVDLVRRMGAQVVGCAFLIELSFLSGRDRLDGLDVHALVAYDEE